MAVMGEEDRTILIFESFHSILCSIEVKLAFLRLRERAKEWENKIFNRKSNLLGGNIWTLGGSDLLVKIGVERMVSLALHLRIVHSHHGHVLRRTVRVRH